jgi:hypothetical protein
MTESISIPTRLLWLLAAAFAGAAIALFAAVEPAAAVDCSDFPYAGEQGMINSDCRENTIDPGVGSALSRFDLLEPRANAFLNANGFSDQWLWYAPQTRRTFTASQGVNWSFCDTYNPDAGRFSFTSAGFVCDGTRPLGFTEVTGSFQANSVSLSVFSFGGGFISRACGNFSEVRPTTDPIPKIRVFKFHDYDGDGVRDSGEPPMAGVRFTLGRSSSRVGQGSTVLGTYTTNASGVIVIPLNGHGPGTYYFQEQVPDGFYNTTPGNRHSVVVPFGAGARTFSAAPFGNAESETDVVKTFELIEAPETMEVGVQAEFTFETTLTNSGPAGPVTVIETLTADAPTDCTVSQVESRTVILGAPGRPGQPPPQQVFTDVVSVVCTQPSLHPFVFTNEVTVADGPIDDVDVTNNSVQLSYDVEVWADADLTLASVKLDCGDTMDVGAEFTCTATGDIANQGPFGPVNVELQLELDPPTDCAVAAPVVVRFNDVEAGSAVGFSEAWTTSCDRRSLHEFELIASIAAIDPHIRDDASNSAVVATDKIEVFQDVDLAVTDVHLECDEVVGGGDFTCRADVDVVNNGPAPDVVAYVYVDLSRSAECAVVPSRNTESALGSLALGSVEQLEFVWTVSCPESDVLHPFEVTTDVAVDLEADPHAVDVPDPQSDLHIVPTCLETVNPHGKQVPQAPGQGQNEDGFYEISSLPLSEGQEVWIRDTGTGTMFGPFPSGTRVKYIEANGAEPSMTQMGGNNGNGNGQAKAVDYQIRGQGDMQVLVFDEDGGEVTTMCLVPPFPK